MANIDEIAASAASAPPRVNELRRFVRVFFQRRMVIFGLVVLVILFFSAIFAQQLAPHDPYKPNYRNVTAQPSAEFPLGTDQLGRDILSRLIYGSRTAILVGFLTAGIAAVVGMSLGL
ncbi:MAG TPA: hypothetical protein VLH15_05530, partial [Dehalococcoidales bacterium]|nr:hypothetical protein [Dehalococcoidales bacterium]